MRRMRQAVVALAAAGAVSGCSVYDDFTTSDFAKQDSDAIVAAASKAMQDVQSVRLTGQVRSQGNQFFIDLTLDRQDHCTGIIRFGGSNIDIRRVGDRVWFKGDSGAYNRLSTTPLPDHVLRRLSTSWLLVEDDKALRKVCDLEALLEDFAVVDLEGDSDQGTDEGGDKGGEKDKDKGGDDLDGDVPMVVGEETSQDGQTVVEISGSPGGQHQELAWVRSEAPHHVVRIESTSAQDGGTLSLAEFDEDVEVEVPRDKDVIRP